MIWNIISDLVTKLASYPAGPFSRHTNGTGHDAMTNPLVRVKAKFAVKNVICDECSTTEYGDFDSEFALTRTSGAALTPPAG